MHVQATKFFIFRREGPGNASRSRLKKSEQGVRGRLKFFCRRSVAVQNPLRVPARKNAPGFCAAYLPVQIHESFLGHCNDADMIHDPWNDLSK